jgi:hypothetical protein
VLEEKKNLSLTPSKEKLLVEGGIKKESIMSFLTTSMVYTMPSSEQRYKRSSEEDLKMFEGLDPTGKKLVTVSIL